jgi:hypothetical protein
MGVMTRLMEVDLMDYVLGIVVLVAMVDRAYIAMIGAHLAVILTSCTKGMARRM